jgi:hypothetical protein
VRRNCAPWHPTFPRQLRAYADNYLSRYQGDSPVLSRAQDIKKNTFRGYRILPTGNSVSHRAGRVPGTGVGQEDRLYGAGHRGVPDLVVGLGQRLYPGWNAATRRTEAQVGPGYTSHVKSVRVVKRRGVSVGDVERRQDSFPAGIVTPPRHTSSRVTRASGTNPAAADDHVPQELFHGRGDEAWVSANPGQLVRVLTQRHERHVDRVGGSWPRMPRRGIVRQPDLVDRAFCLQFLHFRIEVVRHRGGWEWEPRSFGLSRHVRETSGCRLTPVRLYNRACFTDYPKTMINFAGRKYRMECDFPSKIASRRDVVPVGLPGCCSRSSTRSHPSRPSGSTGRSWLGWFRPH